LQQNDVTMVFSGLKLQVLSVMEKTGLYAAIGAEHFFRTEEAALEAISQWLHDPAFDEKFFPLVVTADLPTAAAADSAPAPPSK